MIVHSISEQTYLINGICPDRKLQNSNLLYKIWKILCDGVVISPFVDVFFFLVPHGALSFSNFCPMMRFFVHCSHFVEPNTSLRF